jgi:hypothetical protein
VLFFVFFLEDEDDEEAEEEEEEGVAVDAKGAPFSRCGSACRHEERM